MALTSLSYLHLCEVIRAPVVSHIETVFPLRTAVDQLITTLWCESTGAGARCRCLVCFGCDTVYCPQYDANERVQHHDAHGGRIKRCCDDIGLIGFGQNQSITIDTSD